MKAHKALRTMLLLFLVSIGPVTPSFISPPVTAVSSTGQTTLYFSDALSFLDEENLSEFGFLYLSTTPPTKQNDSEYPPSLILKDTTKLLPRYKLNLDQWITWFASSWLLYFLQDSPEFNFSDLFPGLELFFPHPFRIVEGYGYNGNESVTIGGDVIFNLYFQSDFIRQKFRDQVKVELYSMNLESEFSFPKLIKNTTVQLTPERKNEVYKQQIILSDIGYTLAPGDSLLFSVEIIPSNKTLSTFITKNVDVNRFLTRWEKRANFLENRSRLNRIQELGTTLKEMISILKEGLINITSQDFAAVINAVQSSSLIYDSVSHPSSVSVPAKISEEDIRIYYLHSDQTMDDTITAGGNETENKLGDTPLQWTTPALERNKIVKVGSTFADLYIYHRDLFRLVALIRKKITIALVLYDNETVIGTSEKQLDRVRLLGLIRKPTTPITFNFTGQDTEISYGHSIRLAVSLQNGTKLGFRTVKVLYDSLQYPSSLRMKVEETQNIQITNMTSMPEDGRIIPGETVQYNVTITSKFADTLHVDIIEREKLGEWEIIAPDATLVGANSKTTLQVTVTSRNNKKEAYGNNIDFIIVTRGNTGIDRRLTDAEVTDEAIEYDVEILGYSSSININKGGSHFFYFIIKNNNSGAIDDVDSYSISATSENNWPVTPRDSIRNLGIGKSTNPTDAKVFIEVPKNTTLRSDRITITVASDGNPSATVTITISVTVIGGGVIEDFLEFFDSAARSFGLHDMFGSDAKFVLIIILATIIIFLLIIIALVLSIKPVQIICKDRIKEIESTEKAIFQVTLRNPSKKLQSYEIKALQTKPSPKWMTAVEPSTIAIDGRQTQTVQVIVSPTDVAEPKDWTQVSVSANKTGKKNKQSIALMTMMKEGKTLLQIHNVSHWPMSFHPGEKVITSFSLANNGSISARNVKVFFYLNGKQKNTLTISLPAGNVADIQMPWIGEKGKNQVRIRVKE